ncbi:hypothetical protein BGZ47_003926, partial [Haplosporangium gracile]
HGLRSINLNNLTSAPLTPAEIVYVDIYPDPKTKQGCILWEDIQLAFYNALHVRHKARIVPFVKDSNLKTLKPLRFAVIPGEVLDSVVGNPQATTPQRHQQQQQQQQPSVFRQIEQQAACLPRHNPLSTLRPITSTHPSSLMQNARFAPAGNKSVRSFNNSRKQLDETTIRARNKELAHKYAKEVMTKVAANMDLDALHAKGDGPRGDFWKALECYLRAVSQSHAHAQVSVGDLILGGDRGVTKDSSVAMGWYLKAAFQGDTNAQRKLEALRLSELRQTTGLNTAINYTSENQGCSSNPTDAQPPNTMNKLSMSKNPTTPVAVNFTKILLRAEFGDKDAQAVLGGMYSFGRGVHQDYIQAMDWYLKAAKQGLARAQHNIGVLYDRGFGVPQDYAQAMDWFLIAAEQGHADAQHYIGVLYDVGRGVSQDYAQAMD